jgi:hypothetical protein
VEHRRKGTRAAAPGRIAPSPESLARIEAILDAGGQIMLGTLPPVEGTAVAHDGKKTVAMLRRRPNETVAQLLARLDDAIGKAKATGQRVDEINVSSPTETYEVANPVLGRRVNAAPR